MSARTPIKILHDIILKKGLIPLFEEYKDSRQKLKVKCPKHGIFHTSGQLLKRGNGCRKCGREIYAQKRRGPLEKIAKKAVELGVKLLDTQFPNIHGPQRLRFECPVHGEFTQDHRQMRYGRGCSKCGHERGAAKNRKTTEQFEAAIAHTGYKVLSPYVTSSDKIKMGCPIHGEFEMIPSDLLGGHGCQKCGLSYSKTQGEIFDFVKVLFPDAVNNTRTIIRPFELDIYIPSIKLAIEFCGLHWHNIEMLKRCRPKWTERDLINYHKNKLDKCNSKGVRLITIFEDEWMIREHQVKNFLFSVFKKTTIRIGARETLLKEISKKEANIFLEENHIQGKTNQVVSFGLFYNNSLVAVMTGGKHHRQGHEKPLVLSRLAFSHGITIYGGASKLLIALLNYARQNNYSKIISWSDNRYSEGNVYKSTGFTLAQELKPDYSYVKGKYNRFSKQACQKKHLVKKGAIGNTEEEMAASIGLHRIYDCGKKRWEISLS